MQAREIATLERAAPPPGMVAVPGGTFRMGSDRHYPEEAPAHLVTVDGFWMDPYPVTNREFRTFVRATGHVTVAQKTPKAEDYPGALPHMLYAGSLVFNPPRRPVDMRNIGNWWSFEKGVDWRHPTGPRSNINSLDSHPVVHVAYADAMAYARWAGKDLPTEAEWELASRGGLDGAEFAWGDELVPGGRHMANTWQGVFPHENLIDDGFVRTSPVTAFPANGYGLYDMIGNVWEWTKDWYRPGLAPAGVIEAGGPLRAMAHDPAEPGQPKHVIKGGSFLCADNYCFRYRPAARTPGPPDGGASHVGFRTVLRTPIEETAGD